MILWPSKWVFYFSRFSLILLLLKKWQTDLPHNFDHQHLFWLFKRLQEITMNSMAFSGNQPCREVKIWLRLKNHKYVMPPRSSFFITIPVLLTLLFRVIRSYLQCFIRIFSWILKMFEQWLGFDRVPNTPLPQEIKLAFVIIN